jgi:hypothetical protein
VRAYDPQLAQGAVEQLRRVLGHIAVVDPVEAEGGRRDRRTRIAARRRWPPCTIRWPTPLTVCKGPVPVPEKVQSGPGEDSAGVRRLARCAPRAQTQTARDCQGRALPTASMSCRSSRPERSAPSRSPRRYGVGHRTTT